MNVIYNKIRIIAVLTEDIFELSKLEHSDYPFEVHPTDVSEFIRELLVEYYDLFQAKRLILQYQIPSKEMIAPINDTNTVVPAVLYCRALDIILEIARYSN
ncbi:sensor histidine kinase, partial [Bacillus thuringiensis]|nr:sensor histidine kinase [Bacillus thuringiensis]